MFNKGAFVGNKEFWRYQNAWYNDKKVLAVFYVSYMGNNKRNKIPDIKIHSR
jgi:hypothetical protein